MGVLMRRGIKGIDPSWDQHIPLTVRFSEVDSMRIVWHGHYVTYCECAREAYLGARGLTYELMAEHRCPAAVIRMDLEYLHPAKPGEVLTARCAHVPGGEPKLECRYEIANADGVLLCVANTTQVFIDPDGQPYLNPPAIVHDLFARIARDQRSS